MKRARREGEEKENTKKQNEDGLKRGRRELAKKKWTTKKKRN